MIWLGKELQAGEGGFVNLAKIMEEKIPTPGGQWRGREGD